MEDGTGAAYKFSAETFCLDDYFLAWQIPKRRLTSEVELGIEGGGGGGGGGSLVTPGHSILA